MYPYLQQILPTKAYCYENSFRHIDPTYLEPPLRIIDGAVLAQQERLNRVDVYIRVLYRPATERPSGQSLQQGIVYHQRRKQPRYSRLQYNTLERVPPNPRKLV
jgi:hypothetical protein